MSDTNPQPSPWPEVPWYIPDWMLGTGELAPPVTAAAQVETVDPENDPDWGSTTTGLGPARRGEQESALGAGRGGRVAYSDEQRTGDSTDPAGPPSEPATRSLPRAIPRVAPARRAPRTPAPAPHLEVLAVPRRRSQARTVETEPLRRRGRASDRTGQHLTIRPERLACGARVARWSLPLGIGLGLGVLLAPHPELAAHTNVAALCGFLLGLLGDWGLERLSRSRARRVRSRRGA